MPGKTSPTTVIKEPPICTTSLTFHWPKPAEQLWYVKTYRRLNALQYQTLDKRATQAASHMSLHLIQQRERAENGLSYPSTAQEQPEASPFSDPHRTWKSDPP